MSEGRGRNDRAEQRPWSGEERSSDRARPNSSRGLKQSQGDRPHSGRGRGADNSTGNQKWRRGGGSWRHSNNAKNTPVEVTASDSQRGDREERFDKKQTSDAGLISRGNSTLQNPEEFARYVEETEKIIETCFADNTERSLSRGLLPLRQVREAARIQSTLHPQTIELMKQGGELQLKVRHHDEFNKTIQFLMQVTNPSSIELVSREEKAELLASSLLVQCVGTAHRAEAIAVPLMTTSRKILEDGLSDEQSWKVAKRVVLTLLQGDYYNLARQRDACKTSLRYVPYLVQEIIVQTR
eukprot:Clim_evm18s155 gene=Clim_evmTU18s155